MTEAESYNGWTNYPTWAVNLWLSNDRGLNDATLDVVANYYDGAALDENVKPWISSNGETMPPIWTLEQCRRYRVADAMKDWIDELRYMPSQRSMFDDLLDWALGSVNWDELAEGWIITLEEQRSYDRQTS